MWLIETETLKLEYFSGDGTPSYAILSHTWGDGEVTFQDWQDLPKASTKTGLAKIRSACAQAMDDGHNYIWIDTSCIDKSSSAELSEAINSMFALYRNSVVCYVYLADVGDPDNVAGNLGDETDDLDWGCYFNRRNPVKNMDIRKVRFIDSFRKSRWFTRGWTLQELLAPNCIRFFTQDLKPISMDDRQRYSTDPADSKGGQQNLLLLISEITGIGFDVLVSLECIMYCTNGEKLSWMAGRKTTRVEDMAYCLLGIFDINIPLLYGEGGNAFKRLQEEIAKQSTHFSLFSWQWPQDAARMKGRHPNLFAESTELFSNFNTKLFGHRPKAYEEFDEDEDEDEDKSLQSTILSMTNFGLSINTELIPTVDPNYVFGVQNCSKGISEPYNSP